MRCSPKSHGRTKGDHCCFNVPYFWKPRYQNFICRPVGSNLSHNHQLLPQLTVIDGRTIVNMESSLSPEEFNSIKEQSRCRVNIPLMHVNMEEYFPDRSFSSSMLHRMRFWFLKEKYGADGHNLQDLFMEGGRIWHLGRKFIVVPSVIDFSIETIHCQTKLMGEIKLEDLSCMTIVVQIQIVLMVNVVLQLIRIAMTNPNVKYPLIQYLDWFMTLMRMEMPVWFSFVINHI